MAVGRPLFGEVPGYPAGSVFKRRADVMAAQVHRVRIQGIYGNAKDGAESIVVNGGYEDDEDFGDEIIYTGAGGNDPNTGRQVKDQTLDNPGNAGLVTSALQGLPVRVVRGSRGDPKYSPASGYRYDGLYRVEDYWSERGRSGFLVWRYRLVKLSDDEAAPYLPKDLPKDASLEGGIPEGNIRPEQKIGTVQRIARSTAVVEYVKKLYDYSCQVCGIRLAVPGGMVAEGAHIRALGRPHFGADKVYNVLCLCPNHHALFDRGGIYITDDLKVYDSDGGLVGVLQVAAEHEISRESLRYHRSLWGKE